MVSEAENKFFVFADTGGDLHDNKQRVVTLATLIVSESQRQRINGCFTHLKKKAKQWGIDTDKQGFEFHTNWIFSGRWEWRYVTKERRMRILKELRGIVTPATNFAMVVINKDGGGERSLDRFHEWIGHRREEALAILSKEKSQLETLLMQLQNKKGFGPLGDMTALLFGLTTGLMHWSGVNDQANTIVDEEFVRQIEGWDLLFQLNMCGWPMVARLGLIPMWPKGNQPDWHLGATIHPEESCNEYGLQLVDFIAHTTNRFRRNPIGEAGSLAVVRFGDFHEFNNYGGIELVLPCTASCRQLIFKKKLEQRDNKTRNYYWRKRNKGKW